MNKKQISCKSFVGPVVLSAVLLAALPGLADPPRPGEAVVVATVGKVQARVFTGPVHEGRTEVRDLSDGKAVGEATRVMSGKNGRACIVLSPGAVLCVAEETELTFRQLRRTADGLPKSEEDLIRRIHIELHKGRILLHGGVPSPSLDIRIQVDAGEIEASGGTFVVAQTGKGEWAVINEEYGNSVTPQQSARAEVPAGSAYRLTLMDDGTAGFEEDSTLLESPARQFEVCNCFFDDMETYIHDPAGFDREGLSRYIGEMKGSEFVGSEEISMDVSPYNRTVVKTEKTLPPAPGQPGTKSRWDPERVRVWYDNLGVVKGVNYIPRNAVNSIEMWQEETFDPDLIDEELGWAREAGYTTLRVQLQYAAWKADPEGFMDRLEAFMDLASRNTLKVVPVLFDDRNFAGTEPRPGPQPDPVRGQHNSRWVPSPGPAAIRDRSVWPDLEKYVRGVMEKFKRDDRIVYWDLYNRAGDGDLREETLPLMDQAFNWARDVDPEQPLASAAWTRPGSAMTARTMERSDIITFQSFDGLEQVEALLMWLKRYDRPVICSDWLMRQRSNNFEKILPLFAVNRVGWFNHGLVKGKTQEWIQQDRYRSETEPDVWQHDVLNPDGTPYSPEEIEKIQEFRFLDSL
jgi:hypothetical protein